MDKKTRIQKIQEEIRVQEEYLWNLREKEQHLSRDCTGEIWEWGPGEDSWLGLFLGDGQVFNITENILCDHPNAQQNIEEDGEYLGTFSDVFEVR